MWNGNLVIDAVGHTYDFSTDNRRPEVPVEGYDGFIQWLYGYGYTPLERKEGGYMLTLEEWRGGWTTEELLQMFFVESDTDMVAMHAVNFFDLFVRGANPWEQCLAVKEAAPHRTLLYPAVDPLSNRSEEMAKMTQRVEAGQVDGFKFYPVNGLFDHNGAALGYSFADEKIFPFFEHARSLGIKHIAVHKAVPTAPGPHHQDRPEDVSAAAAAFPDMTFEVVHSGWAFLDDCAFQLQMNANIYANLETTANTAGRMPRRFLKSVGALLAAAPKQVLFGTGAPLGHPQPIIEGIADIQMPEDLLEEGLPELTDEVKADLFGGNFARMMGIDVEQLKKTIADDEFSQRRAEFKESGKEPWALKRARIAAGA